MKRNILIPFLLLSSGVTAQLAADTSKKPLEISIMIRKGLETKDDKDKPAVFSLTWPQDDKANSYLINGAIAVNFVFKKSNEAKRRRLELSPSFIYNRNNQIKKEQNNLKGVLAADYLVGKEDIATKSHSYFKAYPSLQYMNNKKDTSRSFFATAYFTWVAKTKNGFLLSNYRSIGNTGLLVYAGPSVGFEYQNRFDVKKPGTKGTVTRFFFGGDLRLAFKDGKGFPRRSLGFKRVEVVFSYAGREELTSTLTNKEGYIYLLKTEFNYFPMNSENLALGLSYNDGEDPIGAVEKQKFWQFAIKFKLDYPVKK